MAERKRTLKRTSFTGKRKVVRRRKKSRGHSLLLLLFFLGLGGVGTAIESATLD